MRARRVMLLYTDERGRGQVLHNVLQNVVDVVITAHRKLGASNFLIRKETVR